MNRSKESIATPRRITAAVAAAGVLAVAPNVAHAEASPTSHHANLAVRHADRGALKSIAANLAKQEEQDKRLKMSWKDGVLHIANVHKEGEPYYQVEISPNGRVATVAQGTRADLYGNEPTNYQLQGFHYSKNNPIVDVLKARKKPDAADISRFILDKSNETYDTIVRRANTDGITTESLIFGDGKTLYLKQVIGEPASSVRATSEEKLDVAQQVRAVTRIVGGEPNAA